MVNEDTSSNLSASWRGERRGPEFDTVVQPDVVMSEGADDVQRDPVSHEPVTSETARWRSFYNGKTYCFTSADSKKIFDENPEVWVSTPHASVNSATLTPVADER